MLCCIPVATEAKEQLCGQTVVNNLCTGSSKGHLNPLSNGGMLLQSTKDIAVLIMTSFDNSIQNCLDAVCSHVHFPSQPLHRFCGCALHSTRVHTTFSQLHWLFIYVSLLKLKQFMLVV
jgi:hypothetical protein